MLLVQKGVGVGGGGEGERGLFSAQCDPLSCLLQRRIVSTATGRGHQRSSGW